MSETTRRQQPHSAEAEESLIGVCLSTRSAWEHALSMLVPEDFYLPACAHTFTAIRDLAERGSAIDITTVASWLAARALLDDLKVGEHRGRAMLNHLFSQAPASANAQHYARLVIEQSVRRKLIHGAHAIQDHAYNLGEDIGDVIAFAAEQVERASLPVGGAPDLDVFSFIDQGGTEERWVIPGLLQHQERLLLVAAEKAGKTTLQRQMAVLCSAGLNPFTWEPIPRIRALIVDLENPEPLMRKKLRPMVDPLIARELGAPEYDPSYLRICARTEGINLDKRADQMWLAERVQANATAMGGVDLLCIGPIYKMDYEGTSKAEGARRVQDALDQIRKRHGCAIVLETHAPHESFTKASSRSLRPAGSRDWLRWPEFCRAFEPYEDKDLIGVYADFYDCQGYRDERAWPRILQRDAKPWPWVAHGYPRERPF